MHNRFPGGKIGVVVDSVQNLAQEQFGAIVLRIVEELGR
jgi:hypothetical protein